MKNVRKVVQSPKYVLMEIAQVTFNSYDKGYIETFTGEMKVMKGM